MQNITNQLRWPSQNGHQVVRPTSSWLFLSPVTFQFQGQFVSAFLRSVLETGGSWSPFGGLVIMRLIFHRWGFRIYKAALRIWLRKIIYDPWAGTKHPMTLTTKLLFGLCWVLLLCSVFFSFLWLIYYLFWPKSLQTKKSRLDLGVRRDQSKGSHRVLLSSCHGPLQMKGGPLIQRSWLGGCSVWVAGPAGSTVGGKPWTVWHTEGGQWAWRLL